MNPFGNRLIGESAPFNTALRAAQVVAACDVSVLILGETGTGKELLARALHDHSARASHPFITVNCAALPEALADAELFGHRKGAFTGASDSRSGRVTEADGGTLFLDEVGELSLRTQAKLLRFLESGECQVVGGGLRRVDVRVVAATNRDLRDEVERGNFREDLFYRLHVVPLELPPLRERTGDIPLLLRTLTAQMAEKHGLPATRFSVEALRRLNAYRWPGNVRELRNLCERMSVLFAGCEVGVDNLPAEFHEGAAIAAGEDSLHLETMEIHYITRALKRTNGNRSQAARLLGITRDTLLYRLKKHALAH